MLPILKEAGVVDSGGKGLVAILEGMRSYLHGEALPALLSDPSPPHQSATPAIHLDQPPPFLAEGRYGYDVQYLIRGDALSVVDIRARINGMGDCPLVVGDETLVKVHVHVLNPGEALTFGAQQGLLDDVVDRVRGQLHQRLTP